MFKQNFLKYVLYGGGGGGGGGWDVGRGAVAISYYTMLK